MKIHYKQGPEWPKYAKKVLFWNWFTWVLNFMDRGLIGPLLPLMIPFFGLTKTEAGGLVSLFFAGYLSTFVGGFLSDKYGRKKVVAPSVFGFGIVTSITSVVSSALQLGIVRVVTGIFEGFQYPSSAAWVSETFPHAKRGKALGIWETGYSLGTLLGTLLATLVGAWLSWRAPWVIAGILSIIVGILMAKYATERPREETPGYDEQMASGLNEKPRFKDVLSIRNVWVVFVLHGLYNFTFWMAGSWLSTYAIDVKGMTFIGGGLLTTILFAGISVGLVLNGYLADTIGRIKSVSLMAGLAAIAMLVFTQLSNPVLVFVFIALAGILGAYISQVIALVTDTTDPAIAGTAFGVALFGGEVGAILGPITGGFIADHFGFQNAIYTLPLTLFAACIIVWLAEEKRIVTLVKESSENYLLE
jgi:MFS family permease